MAARTRSPLPPFRLAVMVSLGLVLVSGALFSTMKSPEPLADKATLDTLLSGGDIAQPLTESTAIFHGLTALAPDPRELALAIPEKNVLGAETTFIDTLNKHIEVDLTHQRLYAFEGTKKVFEFVVSTGKWFPTPTDEFTIWTKLKSTLMAGGNPADGTYYYLPNVPWVMFFSNDQIAKSRGFSLHGTYWHNNFGHPMSHGCVNMRTQDARVLWDWVFPVVTNPKAWSTLATNQNQGTKIIIYGQAPKE